MYFKIYYIFEKIFLRFFLFNKIKKRNNGGIN